MVKGHHTFRIEEAGCCCSKSMQGIPTDLHQAQSLRAAQELMLAAAQKMFLAAQTALLASRRPRVPPLLDSPERLCVPASTGNLRALLWNLI